MGDGRYGKWSFHKCYMSPEPLVGNVRPSKLFLGNGDGANGRMAHSSETQATCHSRTCPWGAAIQSQGCLGLLTSLSGLQFTGSHLIFTLPNINLNT